MFPTHDRKDIKQAGLGGHLSAAWADRFKDVRAATRNFDVKEDILNEHISAATSSFGCPVRCPYGHGRSCADVAAAVIGHAGGHRAVTAKKLCFQIMAVWILNSRLDWDGMVHEGS